jgi:hypothetical protein
LIGRQPGRAVNAAANRDRFDVIETSNRSTAEREIARIETRRKKPIEMAMDGLPPPR